MERIQTAVRKSEAAMGWFKNQRKLKKKKDAMETTFRGKFHECGHRVMRNPLFDAGMSVIILLNLALVIIETDTAAKGEDTSFAVQALSWMILVLFVLELVLRMAIQQSDFWLDGVNVCDFVLVVLDTILNILGVILGSLFPVSFLRIIRLSKLARVAKAFNKFAELRLLVAGLLGSMRAIFWGAVLLVFTLMTFSIVAVQFINPLNEQLASDGDAWGQVMPIIEAEPNTVIFFASSFMCIGMAVLNLIFGVVLDAASEARSKLSDEIRDQELVAKLEVQSHLLELCTALDTEGNGEIHYIDIQKGFDDENEFCEALGSMDVHKEDLEVLWTILDDNRTGSVSYHDFVTSCYKLKSSNTHFMLAYIKFYIAVIKDKICAQLDEVQNDLKQSEARIEEEIKQEEQKLMHEVEFYSEKANETDNMARAITPRMARASTPGDADDCTHGSINLSAPTEMTEMVTQISKVRQEEQMAWVDAQQQFSDIKESIAQLSVEFQVVLTGISKSAPLLPEAIVEGSKGPGAEKMKKLGKVEL